MTVGAVVAAACFPSPEPAAPVCTAGSYVYCRCEDRSEGTRLCLPDQQSFAECKCLASQQRPPLTEGPTDFVPLEVPPAAGLELDAKCAGKIAVIGSRLIEPDGGAESEDIYGAAYAGAGKWELGVSRGVTVIGPPRGALVGNTLVAVWKSRHSFIGWTKFEAGQTTLAPPAAVTWPSTNDNPAFFGGATGRLFHTGLEKIINEGTYTPGQGWDDAISPMGEFDDIEKSGPAAANTASGPVVAFQMSGKIMVQTRSGSGWSAPTAIPGAVAQKVDPVLVALDAGPDDLLLVYVGSNYKMHATTRSSADKKWSSPVQVDDIYEPKAWLSMTAMSGGRALLAWQVDGREGFASVYDANARSWSTPSGLLPQNPKLRAAPVLGRGNCASEATATLVLSDGSVALSLFSAGKWVGPFTVPGMTEIAFAGAGEVP